MRYINTVTTVIVWQIRCDKKGIGVSYQIGGAAVEPIQLCRRNRCRSIRISRKGEVASLDVLRAITVGLFDVDNEALRSFAMDYPVYSIPATSMEFNPQEPDPHAIFHAAISRIRKFPRERQLKM